MERISHIEFRNGEFKIPTPKPLVETYFSIPQDLKLLENISVLDYLKQYVWLSSKRQRECEEVFVSLLRFNSTNPNATDNNNANNGHIVAGGVGPVTGASHTNFNDIMLPTVFLGVGLVDLFDFPASHQCMTELLKFLEHDKYRFREVDYRTWCGIAAFAERMAFDVFFQYENLEKIDFEYLKKYGDWFDISPGLLSVFNIIHDNHIDFPEF